MTTRMQQRRGTATQWTTGNPVLAAGEIGFETDTNKFKIGDGSSTWSALKYFLDIEKLNVDTEGFIRDNEKGESNGVATLNSNGQIPISQLGLLINAAPGALDTLGELASAVGEIENIAGSIVSTHNADITLVHGIADTSLLATTANVATAKSEAITAAGTASTTAISTAIGTEVIDRNAAIATAKTEAISAAASATTSSITAHESDTTSVHGIADTSLLATISGAAAGVETHRLDTTDVHGIADTSVLATATTVADAITAALTTAGTAADTKVSTAVAGLTKSSVGLSNVDNTTDAGKPISTAAQTALDLKAPLANPTFTGTVAGVTKAHVDLGNVDNTADTAKPVSTATQTALDLKANLASPALTGVPTAPTAAAATNTTQVATTAYVRGEVAALVNSAGATLDTLGEIATALGNDANLSTTLTNAIALKAPLASPTFTGTVTIPAGASISGFAPLASPTFTGTVTVAAQGVAFTDGTQTKAGVPSTTNIPTAIAAGAHTLAAGRADQFIPLTGAVVITLPASGYSTGQSIDFYQESGTGASFASTNSVVGTPGRNFRTTNSVVTAMKTAAGWLVFGDLAL